MILSIVTYQLSDLVSDVVVCVRACVLTSVRFCLGRVGWVGARKKICTGANHNYVRLLDISNSILSFCFYVGPLSKLIAAVDRHINNHSQRAQKKKS